MYQRFKVTKTPDASGEIEVFIDKTRDVRVICSYVTLPAYTSNVVRNVVLRRPDGTILGTEKAVYKTSEGLGLVFPDSFVLPITDPKIVVDTSTVIVAAVGDITVDCIYEEVEFER